MKTNVRTKGILRILWFRVSRNNKYISTRWLRTEKCINQKVNKFFGLRSYFLSVNEWDLNDSCDKLDEASLLTLLLVCIVNDCKS